jgi:hypothetical protein
VYQKQFPSCQIKGSLEPTEFGHMLSKGMIPKKCSECDLMFEGECLRNSEITGKYAQLDYGKCEIEGKTEPVCIEIDYNGYETFIPLKCEHCDHLKKNKYRGYICAFEKNTWGDFPRSLDWGDWKPNFPIVGLGENLKLTKHLIILIESKKTAEAVKEIKRLNNGMEFKKAIESVSQLKNKIDQYY